jgi:hypothetical protein
MAANSDEKVSMLCLFFFVSYAVSILLSLRFLLGLKAKRGEYIKNEKYPYWCCEFAPLRL